jgi:hypothetical protein
MFTAQKTIEQEKRPIGDQRLNSDVPLWRDPSCAWCLCEHGIEAGEGSHGICPAHADWLLKQWREHGRRRHQH